MQTALKARLRRCGWRGGEIPMHRALRTLPWHAVRLPALALAVAAWLAAFALGYGLLAEGVSRTMAFWLERLGLNWEIRHIPFHFPLLGQVDLLQLDAPASSPAAGDWLANLVLLTLAFGISMGLPPRALPITYLLRLIAGLHAVSLAYFAVAAERFPYGVGDHTGNLYRFAVALIALLPIMLAGTHYVIERSWWRRLAATLMMIGYFVVSLPFKLVTHAVLVTFLSPLVMPILYLVFGPPLDILLLVALYSWAVSWNAGRN